MSNRKWNMSIVVLFVIFATLMLSFLFSTLRIRELIQPLKSIFKNDSLTRHIVLISQELDNPYWRSIEQGAREASQKYGITLEYIGPFRINPNEQMILLEKAIASKADAVLIQGINDPIYRSLIDKAMDQGIPVITLDTDEPGSRRLSYVGTDNFEAGKRMGNLVVQATGTQASHIGVLMGNELSFNQQQRLQGFRYVIDQYKDLTIVEVRSSNISRLQAAEQAEDILSNHPEVRYMVGLSSLDGLGILEAVQRVPLQDNHIFAFDDLDETKAAIAQCQIESTLVQQPIRMGYDAISLVHEYFQGNILQNQHFTAITVLDRSTSDVKDGVRCP
ncbi:substrate-binding domain-containing protein [Paenibacillus macquariensis]|uniref:substrate-binding domain-containing protein n=1 Tax=Paenibacillus macquariensis TaxID=948756 RepID=UPI002DB9CEFC|nr:substrate-binding domain-containing protein [Paenibacillus macquariensis]MEC0090354.1 substrate-binding domain-containing protein [Paenibacillus macquariensis]